MLVLARILESDVMLSKFAMFQKKYFGVLWGSWNLWAWRNEARHTTLV